MVASLFSRSFFVTKYAPRRLSSEDIMDEVLFKIAALITVLKAFHVTVVSAMVSKA